VNDYLSKPPSRRNGLARRREEFAEQAKLAALLAQHLDPACTYWTALENNPLSRLSGFLQKRRGVGLPA
jgi:hypothetical protein